MKFFIDTVVFNDSKLCKGNIFKNVNSFEIMNEIISSIKESPCVVNNIFIHLGLTFY